MENNEELIKKFLEQLEKMALDIEEILSKKDEKKKDNNSLKSILNTLITSKIEYVLEYHILTENEKQSSYNALIKRIPKEIVDEAIKESINLYYLYENDLLDNDAIKPQIEKSTESINKLISELSKVVEEIEDKDDEYDLLSNKMEDIINLGATLENDDYTPIENIDFVGQVIEEVNLSNEEKKDLLIYLIKYNYHAYKRQIKKKKSEEVISEELNNIQEKVSPELDNLLNNEQVQKRIIQVMGDEEKLDEKEKDEIMKLVKDDLIGRIETLSITPEDAIEQFIEENDISKMNKITLLHAIFDDCEDSNLRIDQQDIIISMAKEYYETNKNLLLNITTEQKECISQYMFSVYKDIENREVIYQNKAYTSLKEVEKEATYEIETLLNLLEVLDDDNIELKGKLCKRLEDIIRCVTLISKMDKEEETIPDEKQTSGQLFFLMKNTDKSLIEEDLKPDSLNKGISSSYYNEIRHQLESIKNRSITPLVSTQPYNSALKSLKKQGIKYTTATRTRVFFIPVGKKDAIITGIGYIDGHDTHIKDQDARARTFEDKIIEMKNRIAIEETYNEELLEANITERRINEILNSTRRNIRANIEDMFKDSSKDSADSNIKTK